MFCLDSQKQDLSRQTKVRRDAGIEPAVVLGLLVPFLGTSLGAACVFFLKKGLGDRVQRGLTGFASGVMVAASIWSLLIPAMEQSSGAGNWAFLPASAFGPVSSSCWDWIT